MFKKACRTCYSTQETKTCGECNIGYYCCPEHLELHKCIKKKLETNEDKTSATEENVKLKNKKQLIEKIIMYQTSTFNKSNKK